jgi:hypothetical protein
VNRLGGKGKKKPKEGKRERKGREKRGGAALFARRIRIELCYLLIW